MTKKSEKESTDERSFEDIIERLEGIAKKLEVGDIELEQALLLFEEGVHLSRSGTQRLDQAEHKLEKLLADGKVEPLDNAQD